jgi:site-specific recombinase XerD
MDLDVLKGILGHVSLDTTSIYVDTERERMLEQSAAVFEAKAES